jgi:uncharacterized protein
MDAENQKHTNRLASEKSPYLLQHQHNPVDWFAWGEAAFAKARSEDKPVLLSIGYSTCHWCHVMERESFEDEKIGRYLNEHFVSIKVDREERPDVDKIYMTALQAMGQGGGWPLNAFLTPELKPFFGGTYFPPETRQGRPSFLQLLEHVVELWRTRRADLDVSARHLHDRLAEFVDRAPSPGTGLGAPVLHNAAAQFKEEYDAKHGGFGSSPKFPRPSQPAFLLRYGSQFNDGEAVRMVLHTCEQMARGGIYDQLGGGFARYSVDARWLVPHFEKMLYDNAQLVHLYLDAHLISGVSGFAETARDILRYVLRDMTHPDGGFYSAEDADSEGKEGKFYCWTRQELSGLLSPEEFNVAVRRFGITEGGNFIDHSDPDPLLHQNVLSLAGPEVVEEDRPLLESAKRKMCEARARRVRPHLDDKILASWNGMMLGAMARAWAVLGDDSYRRAAERNLSFLRATLWDAQSRTLYHRWRDGERDAVQLLDAYANLLDGVLHWYEATLNPDELQFAVDLAESMMARFYDPDRGGFWQSPAGSADLILRIKEDYDGAEPSSNSVAVLALLRLGALTGRSDFKEAAERTLRLFAERMQTLPQAVPHLLTGLQFFLQEPRRVVLAGDVQNPEGAALLQAAHRVYQPNRVILGTSGPVEPFAGTLRPQQNRPTAYVCTGTACQPPSQDPQEVRRLLTE